MVDCVGIGLFLVGDEWFAAKCKSGEVDMDWNIESHAKQNDGYTSPPEPGNLLKHPPDHTNSSGTSISSPSLAATMARIAAIRIVSPC